MNCHIRKLSLAALSVGLCACSMLGERKDSTRLDVDTSTLPQMKVMSKKNTVVENDDAALTANKDPLKVVEFKSKYLPANVDVPTFVKEKKIGLDHVMGIDKQLPKGVDGGGLVFGLGTQIVGRMDVLENPSDDIKEQIGYNEAAADSKTEELIQKDAAYEGQIINLIAQGVSKFDLTKTQIDQLAANTIDDKGVSLTDKVSGEIKKQLSKDVIDVTEFVFGNLSAETQTDIRSLFKPDLGLLEFVETKNFIVGIHPSGEVTAYWLNKGTYQLVPADKVKVETVDGNMQITLEIVRENVTTDDLNKIELTMSTNREQKVPMGQLKIGDGAPVFSEPHKQVSTYTLRVKKSSDNNAPAPNAETTKEQETPENKPAEETPPAAQTSEQQTVTHTTAPTTPEKPTAQPTVSPNSLTADQKTKIKDITTPPAPTKADSTSNHRGTPTPQIIKPVTTKADTAQTKPAAPVDSTKTTTAARDSSAVKPANSNLAIESMKKLTALFSAGKDWFKTSWFNPTMLGHSKEFYILDDDEFIYSTNDYNSRDFQAQNFNEFGKNEAEVNAICNQFTYQRTMTVPVTFKAPREHTSSPYFTLVQKNSSGKEIKETRTYAETVVDQFKYLGSGPEGFKDPFGAKGKILANAVAGIMNTPPALRDQEFKIKICFDDAKKNGSKNYKAFWTSSEAKRTYNIDKDGIASVAGENSKPWFESQWNEATVNGKKLSKFKTRNPQNGVGFSDFNIQCRSDNDCYGVFNLTFRRKLPVAKVMAYINTADMKAFRSSFVESLTNSDSGRELVIQNEIIAFGGFALDVNSKVADAKYIAPQKLKDGGVINYNSNSIQDPIYSTFPGELAEMYLRIIPKDFGDVAASVYASK
jgi:hypothetical protein